MTANKQSSGHIGSIAKDNGENTVTNSKDVHYEYIDSSELWSTSKIIQQLHMHLVTIKDEDNETDFYVMHAKRLMTKIPIHTNAVFEVYIEDLTPELEKQLGYLYKYERKTLNWVMKEAIGRIFEGLRPRYYISRVRKSLKWKFEKKNAS